MCIICWKPKGKENPSEETLKICWDNNNDGAGWAKYMPKKQEWQIKKGFMSWKSFIDAYKAENFGVDDCYVVHFRVGTSGNRDAGNTHPFIMSKDRDECRETEISSKHIVVHNGVVGVGSGIYSDTVCHISDYIAPMAKYYFQDKDIEDIFHEILMSDKCRWFITNGNDIHMIGAWKKDDETGLTWSNETYKALKVAKYNNNRWGRKSKSVSDVINRGKKKNEKKEDFNINDLKKKKRKLTKGERAAFVDNYGDIDIGTRYTIDPDQLQMAFVDENGAIVWENDSAQNMEYIICPHCFRDRLFSDSDFDIGDTVCLKCGAIFYKDTGEVVSYDADIVAEGIDENGEAKTSEDNTGTEGK